ncbi:hypothetical protein ACPPVS_05815 [Cellulomonas sp. McL0617]|uniref:hypothetical protein n=1 Tax=Cellulomonas sp. McL0617 TaxID=3415675 RepID=UPI003CFB1939
MEDQQGRSATRRVIGAVILGRGLFRFRVTYPLAVAWADETAIYVDIRQPFKMFGRASGMLPGTSLLHGPAWSSPWDELVVANLDDRRATFVDKFDERCTFLAMGRESFQPLLTVIQAHTDRMNTSRTRFDG